MKKILMILIPAIMIAGCNKQETVTDMGQDLLVNQTEKIRKALMELYEATDGPHWYEQPNWAVAPVLSQFDRIEINMDDGSLQLDIYDNNLYGELPESLFELPFTKIDLAFNRLYGKLPENIGRNGLLKHADLSGNDLTGTLPVSLEGCNGISLYIYENKMSGKIPEGVLESLDPNNSKLNPQKKGYGLDYVEPILFNETDRNTLLEIYEAFPEEIKNDMYWDPDNPKDWEGIIWGETGRCIGIVVQNKAIGTISEKINDLTALRTLTLRGCQLRTLPSMNKLKQLKSLDLKDNLLYEIPESVGELTSLLELDLSSNKICGSIPEFLNNLTELVSCSLSSNDFSGKIPDLNQIKKLRLLRMSELYKLELQEIPDWICNNTDMQYLDCSKIPLNGNLETVMNKMVNLIYLNLSEDQLSGGLGIGFRNMPNLQIVSLTHNHLSGNLPEFHPTSRPQEVILEMNGFTGEIPESWGYLTSLEMLEIADNRLTGTVPASFRNLKKLSDFRCFYNYMSGYLPEELKRNGMFPQWDLGPQLNNGELKFRESDNPELNAVPENKVRLSTAKTRTSVTERRLEIRDKILKEIKDSIGEETMCNR